MNIDIVKDSFYNQIVMTGQFLDMSGTTYNKAVSTIVPSGANLPQGQMGHFDKTNTARITDPQTSSTSCPLANPQREVDGSAGGSMHVATTSIVQQQQEVGLIVFFVQTITFPWFYI